MLVMLVAIWSSGRCSLSDFLCKVPAGSCEMLGIAYSSLQLHCVASDASMIALLRWLYEAACIGCCIMNHGLLY